MTSNRKRALNLLFFPVMVVALLIAVTVELIRLPFDELAIRRAKRARAAGSSHR